MLGTLPQLLPGPTFTRAAGSARPGLPGAGRPQAALVAAFLAVAAAFAAPSATGAGLAGVAGPPGAAEEDNGMGATSSSTTPIASASEIASPDGLIRAGEACLASGDAGRARELFEQALLLRPDDPKALLGLGRALTARRRYVEADALYRDMEDRHIAAIDARLGRARLRSLQGDHEGARRFYKDALQADPGNVEARLGMAREAHAIGLDAQALAQADNLVLDHPGNGEALVLQKTIHDDLSPRIEITPSVQDDDAGNRLEQVTVTGTFMARPQTAVSVALTGARTTSECGDAIDCAAVAPPAPADGSVATDARMLVAGTVIRVIRPLTFEARVGVFQEEPLDGGHRTQLFGDGVIHWEAGPRLTLRGRTARRPLLDSAALVDRGIHVDTGDLLIEYRLHPLWTVTGTGELGRYSDGNAREFAEATLTFEGPIARPVVTTTAVVRLGRHHDDRDMGYLDPIHYDAETVTVTIADAVLDGRITWSLEGTFGRQAYDPNDYETAPVAPSDSPVAGGAARLGFDLGDRVSLEAWHRRTNDALATAPGFPARLSGLMLRVRL
jgi:tetratricopeptide (TPR) repeat protein